MKIVSTGCAGYLGSAFTQLALDRGHEVIGVDWLWYGDEGMAAFRHHPNFRFLEWDFRELSPADIAGCDGIVHFAGCSNDPIANAAPILNDELNHLGTRALAETAIDAGVASFTFGSSCSIYDGLTAFRCIETDQPRPVGHYATSKYNAELVLMGLSLGPNHLRPTIFRQATVYGASPRMRFDLVVNSMVRDAVVKGIITVTRPGSQRRPLVSVASVAEAHLWALTNPPDEYERYRIYNLVGDNYTILEVAERVMSVLHQMGVAVAVQTVPMTGRQRDYAVSGDALNATMKAYLGGDLDRQIAELALGVRSLMAAGQSPYDPKYENLKALAARGVNVA